MNYSHSYHAGNFADVFKHFTLILILKSLLRKNTPFCYLDTHAGAGFYDLFSDAAKKNKEYQSGIQKIYTKDAPPLVKEYLACVQRINSTLSQSKFSSLRFYPGSPLIAKYFLRAEDRMILTELHPKEYQPLKTYFANNKNVSVHLADGYSALKAFLPFKEKRGLILIDPPYERPQELNTLPALLNIALKRFRQGIYALWVPIKDRAPLERFYANLKETIKNPTLALELNVYPNSSHLHLNGSSMVIINPPWTLIDEAKQTLPWLWKNLNHQGQGNYLIQPLIP